MQILKNITRVFYKRLFFSVTEYFLTGENILCSDINYFIQAPTNAFNKLSPFYTLLINLEREEEQIWKDIYHRTQTEIKSFLNNSDYSYSVQYNLSANELKKFISLYNSFASDKKIRKAERYRLTGYLKAGILAVSFIKHNGSYIYINIYRITVDRAVNLHSFRPAKINSEINNTYYGKAHRALHWLDIKEFKQAGIKQYDFGGWYNGTENRELLNINAFKEQFTSAKTCEYTGVIYKNILLKGLKKLLAYG